MSREFLLKGTTTAGGAAGAIGTIGLVGAGVGCLRSALIAIFLGF